MLTEENDVINADSPEKIRAGGAFAQASLSLAIAAFAWCILYLLFATPGRWFTDVPNQRFTGEKLTQSRGVGRIAGTNYLVVSTEPGELAIASLDVPHLRATDFRRVRWILNTAPDDVSLSMLWRSDQVPG